MKRVFLGHPKDLASIGFADADLSVIRDCVASAMRSNDPFAVVTGHDDYFANEARTGGFQGWPLDVVERVDVMNGKPWYDVFLALSAVPPPFRVGRATADIFTAAFALRRRVGIAVVVRLPDERRIDPGPYAVTFWPAARCAQVEHRNWQTGWELS